MKKSKVYSIFAALALSLSLLIGAVLYLGPKSNFYLIPPSPRTYGQIALKQMDSIGLYAQGDDWNKAKNSAEKELKTVSTYSQARKVLSKVVKEAGGKHSFIQSKQEISQTKAKKQLPTVKMLEQQTLLVTLPEFLGSDPKEMAKYADALNNHLSYDHYKAVIINLANNGGGNMAPMLIGLSSLLPDGKLFSSQDKYQQKTDYLLAKNKLKNQAKIKLQKAIHKQKVPIALVINGKTASSAEMVALSFKGMEKTRYFGVNSASYTTVNMTFPLYDGAEMMLSIAKTIDRNGQSYENQPIIPDQVSSTALEDAQKWLSGQVK
ncbi:S41 family peptidase [Streptococcus uberis]|uniref:S41 family peptidase n=1 Tax=Streptococcus uberis TaxID=1349 RepID=UPI000543460D|nr:S41 family peptidase [Streptococcus uberis]KHD41033.1 hypothetical protein NA32_02055 [Streptococcus hongkongensis]SQG46284.1 Nisin-resistance protein [Streptococcus uberis]